MNRSYEIIQPPFTFNFAKTSKKELGDYLDWFLRQIPGRIAGLEHAVKASPKFANWCADLTPESLDDLGDWFEGQVESRARTEDEMEEAHAESGFPLPILAEELTNRTFSLAMDSGMYLAEALRSKYRHLKWHQYLDSKRFVDYGQPVLVGFGPSPLNPVRIVITVAYSAADGERDPQRLRAIFEHWSALAAKEAAKP